MGRVHNTHANRRQHTHRSRTSRALRTLSSFFGMESRHNRDSRVRVTAEEARRIAERAARRQRELQDFQARVELARRNGEATRIRSASRAAAANRQPLPDEHISFLAAIEGARIERPGHARKLAEGLVVRLMKYHDGYYYFLSNTGYYYKSADRYGKAGDLDFVVNTWVPLTVRMFAEPYRQMCRR
ncbi:hypothetical protein F4806DRAFT_364411 [Annulohypoxylon nitens]|nr:hypothetical protein F4806DRAFT_364411 [Annulohypoxylon nitens]